MEEEKEPGLYHTNILLLLRCESGASTYCHHVVYQPQIDRSITPHQHHTLILKTQSPLGTATLAHPRIVSGVRKQSLVAGAIRKDELR